MRATRNRLAVALDVPDLDEAEQIAKELAPWFGVAKIGLELYSAAGPEAIARMRALDFEVFADDRRTRRDRARPAGCFVPQLSRGGWRRHVARGRRRPGGGRGRG